MYEKLRPLLFALDAEQSHRLSLKSLRLAERLRMTRWLHEPPEDNPVRAFGLAFPNPVGLAAGLDKNGEYVDALGALGFGFIEVGTVTPWPQSGKPKPRLFRLPEGQAIINRVGFNNDGVEALVRNVEQSSWSGVLGINIGKNLDTPNEQATRDYLTCLRAVYPCASYVTVNISSPNTAGLRDLQGGDALRALISSLLKERDRLAVRHRSRKPLLLKIAPDLDETAMDDIARVVSEMKPDGLICTNTTISREGVQSLPHGNEEGGLSGRPLLEPSNRVLRGMRERLGKRPALIGVGGILDGDDAAEKFRCGARLVQIYSGLIYRGPFLVTECVNELRRQFDGESP